MPKKVHKCVLLLWTLLFVPHSVRAGVAALTSIALRLDAAIDSAMEYCPLNKRIFRMFGERHVQNYVKLRKSKAPLSSHDIALAKCYGKQLCSRGAESVRDAEKLWSGAVRYCTDDMLIMDAGSNEKMEVDDSTSPYNDEDTSLFASAEGLNSEKSNVSIDLGNSFYLLVAFALGVFVALGFYYVTSKNPNGVTMQRTLRRPEL